MTRPLIHISDDPVSLARDVSLWIADLASAKAGLFALCLSGGSTPQRLYETMVRPPVRDAIPWPRMRFFFGDERFVPPDDPRSNIRMAHETLFDHAPVAPDAIVAPVTQGLSLTAGASAYEAALQRFYGASVLDPARPLFDVTLLGLGTNGHTASLMPDTSSLDERSRWVVGVEDGKVEPRLTLTFPAIASSAQVAFLVAGADKRVMLKRLLAGDAAIPAGRVTTSGALHIFADAAAAGEDD